MASPLTQNGQAYGMLSERTRRRMTDRLRQNGISDERVLKAMHEVPRHLFVDQALATRAYDDVSLPIGHGQTISQPLTVARMTELLLQGRQPGKILEIGTGCGYQAAVLLKTGAEVYSMERLAAILDQARRNLRASKLVNARLVHGDGNAGLPEAAPFDGIIVAAAARSIPGALVDQLAEGGRMVLPLGETEQHLWLLEKTSQGVQKTKLDPVKFVPLLNGRS
ncbi:protein-L-isoaspartate(D-aspartate) O-methyltransferase [Chromobacterium subtsugae]|uniref:Protein-L-isoaspartate O-methyltransferase n=1 Tax=Chromobacterium subtsugae TaxID=251747 RepID=A0ABS7FDH1_9NEIS|nr:MULTISPECIES: protein-L-isoaspartate(D-aspartate) O-methyltransferase [Chromobacterium]KUM03658.1 protein-L-isoaspartate O-methyltransferase [Chromobacterium subtsugae]KZE86918.1 protein-L-isoaspartate O-methyltransferase [Chromobacterium sp. F49]MBW7566821.1 protein-L-isoaspartate(D-aspartate) O-methyltransferase [Chromobacterium subtsugae]MBW8288126.1 protein-L-isoaspartate(D-aspartate) O-methyltransferase [Chromobacterium subtsugae]OBU86542.1 protein-L-isoaspartate O-methyltransferase [C